MRKLIVVPSVFLAGALAVMTSTPARAGSDLQTYDKLAYMTFGGQVQIPWATLGPGTYRFRLANPGTSRNVVQVLSEDGSVVYSMFHTIPDHRFTVTEEPIVTFKETPAGTPPAIRSLFYGGEERGYEFIYPEGGAPIATPAGSTELSYIPNAPEVTVTSEPAELEQPELVAEVAPAPEVEPVEEPSEPASKLPATASPLPVIALGGVTSWLLALGAHFARRRRS